MRPTNPWNIVAATTMWNFRPRPNASQAANLRYGKNNLYGDVTCEALARAVGLQRYRTALLIMSGATAIPDELRAQYERLYELNNAMTKLYDTWYGDRDEAGARFLTRQLYDCKFMDAEFRAYKEITGLVIRLSRRFRRGKGNRKGNGEEIAAELKKDADKIEWLKESIETIMRPLLPKKEEEDADDSE